MGGGFRVVHLARPYLSVLSRSADSRGWCHLGRRFYTRWFPRSLFSGVKVTSEVEVKLTMASQYDSEDLASVLKAFHDRAKLAEERLEKLEAALVAQKGPAPRVDTGILDSLIELKAKLEHSRAEQLAEREKAAKEKEKLQYQIVHLKRSLEEADKKLVQCAPST